MTVRAPQNSNFKLYYSLTDLTNLSLDMALDGDIAKILVAKIKTSADRQQKNKRSLSIIAGVFDNELAHVYKRINQEAIEERDWTPAFELWEFYAFHKIANDNNRKFLESFEGMVISDKNDSEFSSKIEFSSSLSGNYSAIPFIKIGGEANFDWKKETEANMSFSIYDIYIKGNPQLKPIPKPDKIKKCWEKRSSILKSKYDLQLTPNNDANRIEIEFGPITSAEQINHININLNQSEALIPADKKIITGIEQDAIRFANNRAYIPLRFIYNETFFETINSPVNVETKLKVTLGNPVNNLALEKEYTIKLRADGVLIPDLVDGQPLFPEATVADNSSIHQWQFDVIFKKPNGSITAGDILKGDIVIDEPRLKFLFTPPYLKEASCKQKADLPNHFSVTIRTDIPKDQITFNDKILKATLNLKPVVNNTPYSRPFIVTLTKIQTPEAATSTDLSSREVLVPDIQTLESSLNADFKLASGETIGEVKKRLSAQEFSNYMIKLISDLKILYEPGRGYLAKGEYLDKMQVSKINLANKK